MQKQLGWQIKQNKPVVESNMVKAIWEVVHFEHYLWAICYVKSVKFTRTPLPKVPCFSQEFVRRKWNG